MTKKMLIDASHPEETRVVVVDGTRVEELDFESAAKGNNDTFKTFFHGMLQEGVYIAPSAFETWFLCEALSYEDLDRTIQVCDTVTKNLK